MEAKQTSLVDLLERIPQGARLVVEHDQFSSSSHPVGRLCHEAAAALRAALKQQAEPVEPVAKMTAHRAVYFMERFKREEKMLGPNEQAALDFVISMLEAALAEPMALDWLHKWANQDDGEPETQWHEGYEAARRVVQIHLTAPPQRKPLTQEDVDRICASLGFAAISPAEIVRAVERAHGIGETK